MWAGFTLVMTHPRCAACAAVTRDTSLVVNANQTVIILWDAKAKRQHFIRQASFKSDARDVGFIVPSPSRPELDESGDKTFRLLLNLTAPQVSTSSGFSLGCSATPSVSAPVVVHERKRVAGFDAVVLTAETGATLNAWLRKNGYSYSRSLAAWAEPYITGRWFFTALKVAEQGAVAKEETSTLDAAALRISFDTEQPLFPYREPDSTAAAAKLGVTERLLRIYFIADRAHTGRFTDGSPWSGTVRWSGDISSSKKKLLRSLKLPENPGPEKWWLTEFEDQWPYRQARGDVVFVPSKNQKPVVRTVQSAYDLSGVALVCLSLCVVLCAAVPKIVGKI